MSIPKFLHLFLLVTLLLISTGCFRDVDVDQAEEIVIPPSAALDLVYFTLDSTHFEQRNSTGTLIARDIVRLEFLDDDYIRDGLVRADYNFIYTNTFKFPIQNTIHFLSENDVVKYRLNFEIPAGSLESPATINYTEIINRDEIDAIRESIKMSVTLEMQAPSPPSEGSLKLKSKAFYDFEFK
ncbi:hypothetical protein [Salinimicrobium sp. GXAS 041]|uniref:hypothetical protein n=1 Tax=Salinimicrobium sp. GXAS 041 TaxID=3400806 RepID=UPI003C739476